MSRISDLLLANGIIKPEQLAELQHWGYGTGAQQVPTDTPEDTAPKFLQRLDRLMDDDILMLIRETDLEALGRFLKEQKKGELIFGEDYPAMDAYYGVLRTGEYLLPWLSEDVLELLTSPNACLKTVSGSSVYFSNIRELFYGNVRAFMVCTPVIYAPESTAPELAKEASGDDDRRTGQDA